MAWLTVAVGAEGVSETEGQPWVRAATEEERLAWIAEREGVSMGKKVEFDLAAMLVDKIGRPYFLMSVDEETAPAEAVERAKGVRAGEEAGGLSKLAGLAKLRAEEEQRWPRCVVCGGTGPGSRVWVQSMYELAPGVSEGVVHEKCYEELRRRRS